LAGLGNPNHYWPAHAYCGKGERKGRKAIFHKLINLIFCGASE
jgi:hypothetical protein